MYGKASYVCMEQPILRGAAIDLHGEQPEVHGAGQFPRSRIDLHGASVSLVGHRTYPTGTCTSAKRRFAATPMLHARTA